MGLVLSTTGGYRLGFVAIGLSFLQLMGSPARAVTVEEGIVLYGQGDFDQARVVLEECLKDSQLAEDRSTVVFHLGLTMIHQRKGEELDQYLANHPEESAELSTAQTEELTFQRAYVDFIDEHDTRSRAQMLAFMEAYPASSKVDFARYAAAEAGFREARYYVTRAKHIDPIDIQSVVETGKEKLRGLRTEAGTVLENADIGPLERAALKVSIAESWFLEGREDEFRIEIATMAPDDAGLALMGEARADYWADAYEDAEPKFYRFLSKHGDLVLAPEATYYALVTSFKVGRVYFREAEEGERLGDAELTRFEFQRAREKLSEYRFEYRTALQKGLVPNRRLEELEKHDLKTLAYLEKCDQHCDLMIESRIEEYKGTPTWGYMYLNRAIDLVIGDEPDFDSAKNEIKRILEGDADDYGNDGDIYSEALHWEVHIAEREGDADELRLLIRRIDEGLAQSSIKGRILERLGHHLPNL